MLCVPTTFVVRFVSDLAADLARDLFAGTKLAAFAPLAAKLGTAWAFSRLSPHPKHQNSCALGAFASLTGAVYAH